jgi:hypothetical protein
VADAALSFTGAKTMTVRVDVAVRSVAFVTT